MALLHFTGGIILTAAKPVAIRAWGGPWGQWAHQYDVPPPRHKVVRQGWLPRATNIQAAYLDYVPFLFSLATFSYVRTTNLSTWSFSIALSCLSFLFQPRDSFLSYCFSPFIALFNQDTGSIPSLCYSTFPPFFPYSTKTWIRLHEVGFLS